MELEKSIHDHTGDDWNWLDRLGPLYTHPSLLKINKHTHTATCNEMTISYKNTCLEKQSHFLNTRTSHSLQHHGHSLVTLTGVPATLRKTRDLNCHVQTKTETNQKAHLHTSSQQPFQKSVAKCTGLFLLQRQGKSKKKLYQQPQPRDTAKHSLPEHPALSVGCFSITLSTSGQVFTSKKVKTECTNAQKKECPHLKKYILLKALPNNSNYPEEFKN